MITFNISLEVIRELRAALVDAEGILSKTPSIREPIKAAINNLITIFSNAIQKAEYKQEVRRPEVEATLRQFEHWRAVAKADGHVHRASADEVLVEELCHWIIYLENNGIRAIADKSK